MAEPLKNRFLQRPFFDRLAAEILAVYPAFDRARFFRLVFNKDRETLELMGRLRQASEALGATLPADYPAALAILLAVEQHFDGFDHLVFAGFVGRFGVDDLDASMSALETLTRTSGEFAVRPIIRRHPDAALARLRAWTTHPSDHVRRLASEGSRPRLPWGEALDPLIRDPEPILPILEALKDDPSEYVRRSVSNSLGDIGKDHPDLAVAIGARWMAESPARTPLVRHALRTLLKRGHRRALDLFGVGAAPAVVVERLAVRPARVALGGAATLDVALRSTRRQAQTLRLEYAIDYARPGGRSGRKVFKIAEVSLAPRAGLELTRKLSFVDRSVRTHHAGPHAVTLIANGRAMGTARFSLVAAAGKKKR